MSYIGADDLVYNNDIERGIHSGGFSVKSLMMKEGISPIMTINKNQIGGTNQVSDIFNDLVVPNWTLSYHNKMAGGAAKIHNDSDSEDDVIDDDLHDRLLDLVKQHDIQMKENKKKKTRKNLINKKKGGTKRTK